MSPHPLALLARHRAAAALLALLVPALALAQGPQPPPAAAPAAAPSDVPQIAHERYVLDNGLEVILHPDRSVPLVAVSVWYHVGSGDEVVGKSGFAHLFEHMMFQGAQHIGEDVHFDILKRAGASAVNGTTNTDRTNYFEVVPAHHLETALWLESDRMGYMLPLLNQPSLDNQREVVRNERRQRYDNVPYGKERFALNELLYAEGHPYRHLTIGKHEDLEAADLQDVRAFFKKWYVPANATLCLAGDFEPAHAKALVQKWFGSFPTSRRPAHRAVAPTPVQGPVRKELQDPFARLRRVHWAWHTPASYAPGDAELDLLAHALGESGTGRLYKLLVHEQQLAQAVAVYQASAGFSSVFHVVVDLKPDADLAEVERLLEAEIERVRTEAVSERERARAVTQIESTFVWGLESVLARAETLQSYNHFLGTPDGIAKDLARYTSATPDGIRQVAASHLGKAQRVEVVTLPAAKAKAKAPPPPPGATLPTPAPQGGAK